MFNGGSLLLSFVNVGKILIMLMQFENDFDVF